MHVVRDNPRQNMVMQQLRPNQISDAGILSALDAIDRSLFVDPAFAGLAFSETELPIGEGQSLLSPLLEGRLLQALALQPHETVLEIGTGSGYFTALLSKLAHQVITVELNEDLLMEAQQRLTELEINNVEFRCMDASRGVELTERIDAIIATAAYAVAPEACLHSLKVGGRMIVVTGKSPAMQVQRITRINEWQWQTENLFETVMPMIYHAEPKTEFVF
ncbi:protein-L-isoaspartate O-methyltransferase [Methylophaga lonarensis MPL]|uniref:Protein-L-isoaspartate O-methyltransferase n=1 Tax=Methylophaga lonarensis MPL TaxID=1286106 RepID=M7NY99_9GAMM|nr:protein-L-isoaspartate O-methyltransferase [Methylophaga lonarensis]EMR13768.1 protein-L-isoaspartate O-methyltransferase [Methylophaga lonarensis MPL]